jgi:uncharacterized protein YecE (DUF72 family)
VLALRDKTGPFLWQFPPQFAYNEERLDALFRLPPRDTEVALALARRRATRSRDAHLRASSASASAPSTCAHRLLPETILNS